MQNNNPFHRPQTPKEELVPEVVETNFFTELYYSFLQESASLQKEFNALFAKFFKASDEQGLMAVLMVLGIAFIYGALHALGPGHGKSVVSLYCLSKNQESKKAFELGFLIACVHALSALVLTYGIYYLLTTMFSKTFNDVLAFMQLVSGIAIIAIGVYLLVEHFWAKHAHTDEALFNRYEKRGPFVIALAVGLVPCPGVMTVLLFSIALKQYFLGVASAFVMSIGMGLSISLVGALTLKSKDVLGLNSSSMQGVLSVIGSFLIIGLGVVLLLLA